MKNYYNNKKLVINIALLITGIAIWVLAFMGKIPADLWSGIGAALIVIEVLQIMRNLKYQKDSEYKKKIDIEVSDERNSYIRMKAWSWAGYLFILGAAALSLVFFIRGQTQIGQVLCYCMCANLIIYYAAYLILSRKY